MILLECSTCLLPINFPKHDGLLSILNPDWFARLDFITAVSGCCSRIADQNLTALRVRLEPRRCIHCIANGRVFGAAFGTDVTNNYYAGMQAHPNTSLRQTIVTQFLIDTEDSSLHRD